MNPARGVATHRLISEGGRLGGRHVVIGRLQRKLLHFLVLVQMNHLHRKQPRAQQGRNELIPHQENRKTEPARSCLLLLFLFPSSPPFPRWPTVHSTARSS